jgi:hypothetical protein
MTFDVKKKGGAFGLREDSRVWEIGDLASPQLQPKHLTLLPSDALSWCVRNVDLSGGKRKLRWEVNPTDLVVISCDESTGICPHP